MAHPYNTILFNGEIKNEDAPYVKIQNDFSTLLLIFFLIRNIYTYLLRISLEKYKRLVTLAASKER